jgi:hypothetical protein
MINSAEGGSLVPYNIAAAEEKYYYTNGISFHYYH